MAEEKKTGGNVTDTLQGLMSYPAITVFQQPKGRLMEILLGCEAKKKYKLHSTTPDGAHSQEHILLAEEHCPFLVRQCLGRYRPFETSVFNNNNQEIVRFKAPFRLPMMNGLCCPRTIYCFAGGASSAAGEPIGFVKQDYACIQNWASVHLNDGTEIYRLRGSCIVCCEYVMEILDPQGNVVGTVKKLWGGLFQECCTDRTNHTITFPEKADPVHRALLIATTFLIHYMIFEKSAN